VARHGTARIWDYRQGYRMDSKYSRPETADQYSLFQQYLHMPKPRSTADLARAVGFNVNTVARWAKTFNWEPRAAAWDKQQIQLSMKESTALQRQNHRKAIKEYRDAAERQARDMMAVTNDLTAILANRVKVAEQTGEEIPMNLVAGLLKATASISEQGRQAWAAALGVDELMEVVEVELQNAQKESTTPAIEGTENEEGTFEFEIEE
jgi:hypothetical protein